MKSIFRYPGGKTNRKVQTWILSHAPKEVLEYREPFVGGGGILFGLNIPGLQSRWINDLNEGLTEVYRALVERPEEFLNACREIEPVGADEPVTEVGVEGGKQVNARLKREFDRLALNPDCDQALRYFFVNRTVFGGRVNYERNSRLYFSKPEGWDIVKGDRLEQAARLLEGTRVTCGDFAPLFATPGEGVWIYADPPYYRNTHFSGNSQLYQHSFTLDDHKRLAGAVRDSAHKICISYDDDPTGFIRSLYPQKAGFRLVEGDWAYCGSTNGIKDRGRELLILNYDPPRGITELLPFDSIPEKLTHEEKKRLGQIEKELDKNNRSFLRSGELLKEIRDQRLYRADGSFRHYLERRWTGKVSAGHASRLICSHDLFTLLKELPIGNSLPDSESLLRELLRIKGNAGEPDVSRIAEIWQDLVKQADGQPITAKMTRQAVRSALGFEEEDKAPPSRVADLMKKFRLLTDHERQAFLEALRQDGFEVLSTTGTLGV